MEQEAADVSLITTPLLIVDCSNTDFIFFLSFMQTFGCLLHMASASMDFLETVPPCDFSWHGQEYLSVGKYLLRSELHGTQASVFCPVLEVLVLCWRSLGWIGAACQFTETEMCFAEDVRSEFLNWRVVCGKMTSSLPEDIRSISKSIPR